MSFKLKYHGPANRLTNEEGEKIIDGLQKALPTFDVKQYFGSQPGIFPSYDHAALGYDEFGECRGLLASRWLEKDGLRFLYLWTAMIATDERRSGLFKAIVARHFAGVIADTKSMPGLVVTKTYNPVVYAMLKKLLAPIPGVDLYPRLDGQPPAEGMQSLSERIAKTICPDLEFRPESSVVVGGQAVLAPRYFPEMQMCDDPAVWTHFSQNLTRDDQVLCVIRVSEGARKVLGEVLRELA